MEIQAELFDDVRFTAPPGRKSIQESFEAFHRANPWIYRALVKLARDLKAKGRTQYGIGALAEVVRWHYHMTTTDGDDFKLNNNYRSRYARRIMAQEQDLDGFFRTRELKSP